MFSVHATAIQSEESVVGSSTVQSIADRTFRWPREQFPSATIVPSQYLDKWVVSPKARRVGWSVVTREENAL